MNFALVTGPAITVECVACHRNVVAGDLPYTNASRGEERLPDTVYLDCNNDPIPSYYCQECAAKLSVDDPTRSVNQFYTTTAGDEIDHAKLVSE